MPEKTSELLAAAVGPIEELQQDTLETYETSSLGDLKIPETDTQLVKDHFIEPGTVGMIVASSGIGKSVWVMQSLISFGGGATCFGLQPERSLKSLLIQSENSQRELTITRDGIRIGCEWPEESFTRAIR